MNLDHLSGRERREAEELLRALEQSAKRDPIGTRFHSCPRPCGLPGCKPHPKQHEFMAADTKTQAAFAGNRGGKTSALIVKCLIQHYPPELLPTRLRPYRFVTHDRPVKGRLMCPSADAVNGYIMEKLREWAPLELLHGGRFDKAWKGQFKILLFKDGGHLEIRTYEMDADKLVGADLDYVAYDEPPPEPHRNENFIRLIDRKGKEMFALTPVNMKGGGIGWLKQKVWKRREAPEITVVNWSSFDNPHMDAEEVERTLSIYPKEERQARETGQFLHFGGMVYDGGFEGVLTQREPKPEDVKNWDVVVGIDPGLKNAAFVWVGFDSDNRAFVFDEALLQEKTPKDYAETLRAVNKRWGISNPLYVIDPSARNRSLVNAEDVESLLQAEGIYTMHGMNAVEAGVQQIRLRMERKMLYLSPRCRGLRDEAEEYRMQDRPDGEFKVVKENDHRLDACFVAGTLIRTEHGEKPIEFVDVGERVWTRDGLRRVDAAWMSDPAADVFRLGPLVGTGGHPVWTDNRGWTTLDAVRYDDILRVCTKRPPLTDAHIGATPIRLDALIASTSATPARRVFPTATSTATSSSTTSVPSRTGGRSTTATKTRSTTIRRTLRRFHRWITPESTGPPNGRPPRVGIWTTSASSQASGIALRRVVSGIASTATRWLIWSFKPAPSFATTAGPISRLGRFSPRSASARTSASPRGGELPASTMLTARASTAATSGGSTSTRSNASADVPAAKPAGVAPVYNLSVEGCPEYFANGVLVHNCRYAVATRLWTPAFESEATRELGFVPDRAPSLQQFQQALANRPAEVSPMGNMS